MCRYLSKNLAKSEIVLFAKIVNSWKLLTVFCKNSHLDVWQVSEYTSEINFQFPKFFITYYKYQFCLLHSHVSKISREYYIFVGYRSHWNHIAFLPILALCSTTQKWGSEDVYSDENFLYMKVFYLRIRWSIYVFFFSQNTQKCKNKFFKSH